MNLRLSLILLAAIFNPVAFILGLGTSCTSPLGAGTARNEDPFWMENIRHQGMSAFNSNPSGYQVFRNVKVKLTKPYQSQKKSNRDPKNFGAKGDGLTDDTAAIK